MRKHICITGVLLSALILSSAVQSCRSCRKIITEAKEVQRDIRKTVEENKQFMHLSFQGIPMAGNYKPFADSVKSLGFEEYARGKNTILYTGGTYQNQPVDITIAFTPRSRLIYRAAIFLPDRTTWAEVESEYNHLKDSLSALYGPPDAVEYFEPPFKKGDGYEMKAIEKEMFKYQSDFSVYYGAARIGCIILNIDTGIEDSTARAYLLYVDLHNDEIYDKETGNLDTEPDTTDSDTTKTIDSKSTSKDTTGSTAATNKTQ